MCSATRVAAALQAGHATGQRKKKRRSPKRRAPLQIGEVFIQAALVWFAATVACWALA